MPTFGSLFAGIGGIDLGLERAGWTGRWQVEYEPFCQRVLAKHWPDVTRYGDIKDVDWSGVEPVDLVAGGFPCQPVSSAGRQKAQADERWLWPEFLRCIRALRPRYVLVENVTNLLAVNGGSAFGDVLGDLAESGYDAEWDCIPATAVGALHDRDRVWLVAYVQADPSRPHADGQRRHRAPVNELGSPELRDEQVGEPGSVGSALAYPGRVGLQPDGRPRQAPGSTDAPQGETPQRQRGRHAAGNGRSALADAPGLGRPGPRQPVFSRDPASDEDRQAGQPLDGRLGDVWLVEPRVGRVAHGVPARVDRLRSLGNAVVPQVVEFIGRRIIEAEGLT